MLIEIVDGKRKQVTLAGNFLCSSVKKKRRKEIDFFFFFDSDSKDGIKGTALLLR